MPKENQTITIPDPDVAPSNPPIPVAEDNFIFDQETGTVLGYNGTPPENLVIPPTIKNEPVLAIGDNAFFNNNLISVSLPDSIETIQEAAFANNNLVRIRLPAQLEIIGPRAFAENKLKTISIPNSTIRIEAAAFTGNELESASFGQSLMQIGIGAFLSNLLTSVSLPDSIHFIDARAFKFNQITSLHLGNAIETIGEDAFRNNKLASIILPNSLEEKEIDPDMAEFEEAPPPPPLGDFAFAENLIASVQLPNRIKKIPSGCFWKNKISSISVPDSVETIGSMAFAQNQITTIALKNTKKLESNAFQDCPIETITIADNVSFPLYSYYDTEQTLGIHSRDFYEYYVRGNDIGFDNWDHAANAPGTYIYGSGNWLYNGGGSGDRISRWQIT